MNRLFALLLIPILLFTACQKREGAVAVTTSHGAPQKLVSRDVEFYFESPQLVLVAERRAVTLPEGDPSAMQMILRELLKGPRNPTLVTPFPADTTLRAAYLLPDGDAIIDLGGKTLVEGWNTGSHTELMAVYSLVTTVTANFATVKRVRLLINGQSAETLGGHISIDRPLRPQSWIVAKP